MGHIGAQPAPNDAMPCGQVHLIKFCLYDLGDVIEDAALLESESDAIDGMLLHTFIHIGILYHCIFSLLLLNITVWLDNLCVRLSLPLFCLVCSSVSCNLSNCLGLHLHFYYFNNYFKLISFA